MTTLPWERNIGSMKNEAVDLPTQAIEHVREAVQASILGYDDADTLDLAKLYAQGLLMRRRAELREAAEDVAWAESWIRDLLNHRCEWNDDDYCNVCGADGRA